jgi:hypothetical protein
MSSFAPKWYYIVYSDFGSVHGYERHITVHHPDLPGYPGPADIVLYGLKKQGNILGERSKSRKEMEIA